MSAHGYKKYMKKQPKKQPSPLIQVFVFSFFGMLLLFTLIISYVSKNFSVDTSIGEYSEQQADESEDKKIIDVNRLEKIKNEDQGRSFSEIIQAASDEQKTSDVDNMNDKSLLQPESEQKNPSIIQEAVQAPVPEQDIQYKVYIGSYTSAEQANVAKDLVVETDSTLNPIVKSISTNEYTLQVGKFKNKQNAESLLNKIKSNNLPGRIVEGY